MSGIAPEGQTVDQMTDRELVMGLMRGNRAEFKLGYSAINAVLAVTSLRPDADTPELRAFARGFAAGMNEPQDLTYPTGIEDE